MEHGAVLGRVDPVAAEHGAGSCPATFASAARSSRSLKVSGRGVLAGEVEVDPLDLDDHRPASGSRPGAGRAGAASRWPRRASWSASRVRNRRWSWSVAPEWPDQALAMAIGRGSSTKITPSRRRKRRVGGSGSDSGAGRPAVCRSTGTAESRRMGRGGPEPLCQASLRDRLRRAWNASRWRASRPDRSVIVPWGCGRVEAGFAVVAATPPAMRTVIGGESTRSIVARSAPGR